MPSLDAMREPDWVQGDDYARGLFWECPVCEAANGQHETACEECGWVNEAVLEAEEDARRWDEEWTRAHEAGEMDPPPGM